MDEKKIEQTNSESGEHLEMIHRPRKWLQSEFQRKQSKNEKFSLRAFARQLEISSGRLSELLSGKRYITVQMGSRIAKKIGMDPTHEEEFLSAIIESKKARRLFKK